MKEYLLRSMLFVPGHSQRLLESASRCEADAILIDLEDSVLPETNKVIAREKSSRLIAEGLFEGQLVFVRINGSKKHFYLDIGTFVLPQVTGFMLPKVESPYDVKELDRILENLERARGLSSGFFKIIPLIETAAAVLSARDIAEASDRIIAMTFGCEDYIADIDGAYNVGPSGTSFEIPRTLLAIAARAAKVIPIDTVYIDLPSEIGFLRFVKESRKLGFEGTLTLHPKQVTIANEGYSPNEKEIQDAEETIKRFEEAQAQGKGVAMIDGKFIGPPLVIKARKVLRKKELIEQHDKEKTQ